jgi:DNA-binding MarR family transcriptional regulator/GNAT superfamily N-acetyltransferase
MPNPDLEPRIAAVREFNRFYTRKIGVLQEGLLRSSLSLAQVRVLFELAHRADTTATELAQELGLDGGYLSRMLREFEKHGLVSRRPSTADGRQNLLALTASGHVLFAELDERSRAEIAQMLRAVPAHAQQQLVSAMHRIQRTLGDARASAQIVLRSHLPGDMGWVVFRHGVLYAREYGWGEGFEALVAQIVSAFMLEHDPARERCWIAERDGERVGCVFLVRKTDEVAQLRLFLVEPSARGLGVGRRLLTECVAWARGKGYAQITLWTNDVLHAARHLYEQAGFVLVDSKEHESWGHKLVGQTWELELRKESEMQRTSLDENP